MNAAPHDFEKDVAQLLVPQPATREEILERIRGLIAAEKGECAHPQELAARMRNEVTTTWEESPRGIANLQALAPTTVVSWSAILTHFASLVKPGEDGEKLKKENAALREKLDDALMRLELLKGTSGGGPQKYTVPLFNTCFTDVCSWNTWRDQALAWAKENPMVLGTPANTLSWFSRLRSGSAHAFVVGEIPSILANTTTIYEAVLAATTLLNLLFADPDAERRAIEKFWAVKQKNQKFGLFYLEWLAARTALPSGAVSLPEQTRAFVRALRPGLKGKAKLHFLATGIAQPTIEQYAAVAPILDRNCPDTECIQTPAEPISRSSPAPGEKRMTANAANQKLRAGENNKKRLKKGKEQRKDAAGHQQAGWVTTGRANTITAT